MTMTRLQTALCVASVVVAGLSVVAGRLATFDMNEGQTFVHGWPYWAAAVVALIPCIVIA